MLFPSILSSRGIMNNDSSDWEDFFDPFRTGGSLVREMGDGLISEMKTDIQELDNSYELSMNLAGIQKEDIELSIDKGYLTVTAQRKAETEKKNTKYLRRERYFGSMTRNFYVGENITEQDIKAKFDNGVLNIEIPKKIKEEVETKKKINID